MVEFLLRGLTPATLCAAAFAPAAQTPPSPAHMADPLDASASVPALAYESAFSIYKRAADGKPIRWREANDTTRAGNCTNSCWARRRNSRSTPP